jgi:hypothetical protein
MSNIGIVRFTGKKYELAFGGKVIARSKDRDYFEYHLERGDVTKMTEAKITSIHFEDGAGNSRMSLTPSAAAIQSAANFVSAPMFTIPEKFSMMDELLVMTINGTASKAMCICGRGGVGKSFAVQKVLARLGKLDSNKLIAEAMEKDKEAADLVTVARLEARAKAKEDGDDENAAAAEIPDAPRANYDKLGDYTYIKGYSSASALYRLLYENRHRTVIFDDCDSVLKNDDAVNVLKSALDSYEERWVSWNINSNFSDLPPAFKFEGQVIFVTNLPLDKVPEPIRTRCFPVDVSMNSEQRLERMSDVLVDVMPEIDMSFKLEAINLLKKYMHLTQNINFRSLMKVISIRIDAATSNWERLALFTLIES